MFLLFSTEARAFLVVDVFREGDRFTENVKMKFRLCFPNSRCPNRDTVRDLISFAKPGLSGCTENWEANDFNRQQT